MGGSGPFETGRAAVFFCIAEMVKPFTRVGIDDSQAKTCGRASVLRDIALLRVRTDTRATPS